MNSQHVEDRLEAYALGALKPDEMIQVADHLHICAECRAKLEQIEESLSALSYSAGQAMLSPEPKRKLFARIAAEQRAEGRRRKAEGGQQKAGPRAKESWWQVMRRGLGGLALAPLLLSLALVIAAGGWALHLSQANAELSRTLAIVGSGRCLAMTGNERMPNAHAELCLSPDGQSARLVSADLPSLPDTQTYQLWLIRDGQPLPAGLFQPDASGPTAVTIRPDGALGRYQAIGLSIEPRGGSRQPSQVIMLQPVAG